MVAEDKPYRKNIDLKSVIITMIIRKNNGIMVMIIIMIIIKKYSVQAGILTMFGTQRTKVGDVKTQNTTNV